MNYPIESLAIVAPIIFIVLMIVFPVIGVFGGWKRAAYWGGGTFVFYCIGLLVWTFAGNAIASAFVPMIQGLLPEAMQTADITRLTASLIAPVFFIAIMAVAELLLLINYYAWFKRVVGLKVRRDDKGNKIKPKQSLKQKLVNYIGGGVGMGLAMCPSTIAFTQVVYFGTTSTATRAKNGLSKNLYNSLSGLTEKMSWFSYYGNTKSYQDFDALFSALSLTNKTIKDMDGNDVNALDEITNTISGLAEIIEITTKGETSEGDIGDKINDFSNRWNNIMEQAQDEASALFTSENATALITDIMGVDPTDPSKQVQVTEENYNTFVEKFDKMLDKYEKGKYEKEGQDVSFVEIQRIEVSEQSFNNIEGAFAQFINTNDLSDEQKAVVSGKISQVTELFFAKK